MPFKNIKDQVAANKRYREKKKAKLEQKDAYIKQLEAKVASLEAELNLYTLKNRCV